MRQNASLQSPVLGCSPLLLDLTLASQMPSPSSWRQPAPGYKCVALSFRFGCIWDGPCCSALLADGTKHLLYSLASKNFNQLRFHLLLGLIIRRSAGNPLWGQEQVNSASTYLAAIFNLHDYSGLGSRALELLIPSLGFTQQSESPPEQSPSRRLNSAAIFLINHNITS